MSFLSIDEIFNKAILNSGVNLTIVLENIDYDTSSGLPFLACFQLPSPVSQSTLGADGNDLHTGLYQININYPKGCGLTQLKAMADTLNSVFYAGASLIGDVIIRIKNVSVERVIISAGYATLPITIEYYTHIERQ